MCCCNWRTYSSLLLYEGQWETIQATIFDFLDRQLFSSLFLLWHRHGRLMDWVGWVRSFRKVVEYPNPFCKSSWKYRRILSCRESTTSIVEILGWAKRVFDHKGAHILARTPSIIRHRWPKRRQKISKFPNSWQKLGSRIPKSLLGCSKLWSDSRGRWKADGPSQR